MIRPADDWSVAREVLTGSQEQFLAHYAMSSGVTVERLSDLGRRAAWVGSCDAYDFPHWELRRNSDDDFDRRNEVPHDPA